MPDMPGRDAVVGDALAKIARYGVMVTYVGGSDSTVPFAYTAGLTAAGEPELMLLGGLPPVYAQATLNDLAFRVLKDGARYKPGDVPPDLLAGGYEAMICGPVPAGRLRDYPPSTAEAVYGPVRVYQVVYQDRAHRFPWEPGYEMPGQPFLGGGRG